MSSLREWRRKIQSVRSTRQITKAMKMVAAARLRRAQARILAARPFAERMEVLVNDLLTKLGGKEAHPLFARRDDPRTLRVVVTSDRGLCGAFNTNVIRRALESEEGRAPSDLTWYIVGRKGRDFFRRLKLPTYREMVGIPYLPGFAPAEVLAQDLMDGFLTHGFGKVEVVYNEFKSVLQQRLVVRTLLPLTPLAEATCPPWPDFLYEPPQPQLLNALVPRVVKAEVFRILLESSAAELAARMTAMDNATRNAEDLMGALTLGLNRTRQGMITKEILEVVSGAEALA